MEFYDLSGLCDTWDAIDSYAFERRHMDLDQPDA
jgi:hypothetical protein